MSSTEHFPETPAHLTATFACEAHLGEIAARMTLVSLPIRNAGDDAGEIVSPTRGCMRTVSDQTILRELDRAAREIVGLAAMIETLEARLTLARALTVTAIQKEG